MVRNFGDIRLNLPFFLEVLTELTFSQKENEHTRVKLSGLVREGELETFFRIGSLSNVQIWIGSIEGEYLIFSGIVTSAYYRNRQSQEITLEMVSYSILMDLERKKRSFQDQNLSYSDLWKEILRTYDGQILIREKHPDKISAPRVQYEETDWQFMKRLASQYGSNLFVDDMGKTPRIYVGLEWSGRKQAEETSDIKKKIEEHLCFFWKNREQKSVCEEIVVKSRNYFPTGSIISCEGDDFQIYRVSGRFMKGEMIYEYHLVSFSGLPVIPVKNQRLHGSMIYGTVLSVMENKVKLHLNIDGSQDESKAWWFPFHRTDWYCMPEIGSCAALVFPSDEESEAYVTAILRTDGQGNRKTQKPEETYMGTREGKELKTEPGSIQIGTEKNQISLKLTERGIRINSKEDILLDAGESIRFEGGNIEIDGEERIRLCTRKTIIVMDDRIQLKG